MCAGAGAGQILPPPHRAVPSTTSSSTPFKTPSQRELEIAALLAERWSDKEIAAKLGIGAGTVHTHMDRMRRKSGLHDRRALAKWAMAMAQARAVYAIPADTGPLDAPLP